MIYQYDPNGIFEQNPAKGGVCTIKGSLGQPAAAAVDSNLVTAISGKVIRVVSVLAAGLTAATTLTFNTNPAGAGAGVAITPRFYVINTANFILANNELGWFETTVSQGLTCTIGAGSAVDVQIRYIEVVP